MTTTVEVPFEVHRPQGKPQQDSLQDKLEHALGVISREREVYLVLTVFAVATVLFIELLEYFIVPWELWITMSFGHVIAFLVINIAIYVLRCRRVMRPHQRAIRSELDRDWNATQSALHRILEARPDLVGALRPFLPSDPERLS